MPKNQSTGISSILILSILSILGLLTNLIWIDINSIPHISKIKTLAETARSHQAEVIIDELTNYQYQLYEPPIRCFGDFQQLCVSSYPYLDLQKLFSSYEKCNNIQDETEHYKESLSAYLSSKTCILSGGISKTQSYAENIKADFLTVSGNIASRGYIEIGNFVGVTDQLVITAGGDLIIDNLKAKPDQRIVLISASGTITVTDLTGNPKLALYSSDSVVVSGSYVSFHPSYLPAAIIKLSYH